jgi:hypothetical protein
VSSLTMVSLSLLLAVVGEDIGTVGGFRRRSSRPDLLSPSRDSSGGYHCVANSILDEGDVFSEGLA